MKRLLIIFLTLLLQACQTVTPQQPSATPTITPIATVTSTALSTPTSTRQIIQSSEPELTVHIHPEDGLYVGDLVSFEVISPEDILPSYGDEESEEKISVEITVNTSTPQTFGPEEFREYGVGKGLQATFKWVWDTTGLDPGEYELTFHILPEGSSWTQTITLFPHDALPPSALDSEWITTDSECCLITYLTGTAAERDIESIKQVIDLKAFESIEQVETDLGEKLHVVLLPRVLGHGGFAAREIYISYLDRNYAGDNLEQVTHHEIIHVLDVSRDNYTRPRFFVEGFAVYNAHGHFQQELLLPRAAALLDLGWYFPLAHLSNDFYFHQHEISYLEAGALIEFMIDQWGYQAFDAFYRSMDTSSFEQESDVIDAALQEHFGINLTELEQLFLAALNNYPYPPETRQDVYLSIFFFESARRYQELLDPSAYFLSAWLVVISDFQSHDIAADYLRHPSQPENLALETLLASAHQNVLEDKYTEARHLLTAVNAVLDRLVNDIPNPFEAHPLAQSYFDIVTLLLKEGYQPQQITLNENSAQVMVTQSGPNLITISLIYFEGIWQIE